MILQNVDRRAGSIHAYLIRDDQIKWRNPISTLYDSKYCPNFRPTF